MFCRAFLFGVSQLTFGAGPFEDKEDNESRAKLFVKGKHIEDE